MNKVLCRLCGLVVGKDSVIKEIESCSDCSGLKKKSKKKRKKKKKIKTAQEGFAKTRNGPASELPGEKALISFRSLWERNFARCLEKMEIDWDYERLNFPFRMNPKTKQVYTRRPFQYMPDFHDHTNDIIWEVKGYLRSQDKSKIKRFRTIYPNDFAKLKVLCSKNNKATRGFFEGLGVPCEFIEDWKKKWEDKVNWE